MSDVILQGKYVTLERGRREQLKARIAVCGPGGTGKTRVALRLAYTLVGDWKKIAILDTEYNRSKMHLKKTDPEIGYIGPEIPHIPLTPPFEWRKFIDAMNTAERAGMECLIIDTFTHEWEGEGGISDLAAEKGGEYHSWRLPKKYHSKILERILQSPMHIIVSVRAKTEYVMEEVGVKKDGKKKYEVKKIGIRPQQSHDYDYLFDFVFMLQQDHTVQVLKDTPELFKGYDGTVTREVCEKIKGWLIDGEEVRSYTEIKNEAIQYIQEMAETFPQVLAKVKEIEGKKQEELSLWTYQEVMDFKEWVEKSEESFIGQKIVAVSKKNKKVAETVKEYQTKLGKKFNQFSLEEKKEVLARIESN